MILLTTIRLVNWYGFNNITAPIGYFTLIAGKNGSGKSASLDAVKYALTGDSVFNKSTENRGKRTLPTYTRGLLDATAGTYMRPAEQYPNVYTHIVLEMSDVELGKTFVLGAILETNSTSSVSTKRYIAEDKKIDDFDHVYSDNGLMLPYSCAELQKKYNLRILDANDGTVKFLQRTGLRLSEQQAAAFRRKLRSIMSYDPEAKIDDFIRESVLEEKKVDFVKLTEAKNNINTLNATFERIDTEIKELDEILVLFNKLKNARNVVLADDIKIVYERTLRLEKEIEESTRLIDISERQLAEDEAKQEELQEKEGSIRDNIQKVKNSLDEMDCTKAIRVAEEKEKELSLKAEELKKEKEKLDIFSGKINELINWFSEENKTVSNTAILTALTTNDYSAAEKASSVDSFRNQVNKERDAIFEIITRLRDDEKKNQSLQSQQQKIIDDCNSKKTTFSDIPEYVALKNEINKEFSKLHIKSEAKFACEYVLGLIDESWRDSIESFLGKKRYTILVDPEYYDIADDVLNSSQNKYAHLFNTKLLMKKDVSPEEDSIVRFIEVKNPVARQYFEYQLGRMHAVDKQNVRNYENAISKEGRVSVAMDSYYLRFDAIRFYCLGQETIELNRRRAVKELERLKNEGRELYENLKMETGKKEYLESTQGNFGIYIYDAHKQYEDALIECKTAEKELENLIRAQESNTEFMELNRLHMTYRKELAENINACKKVQESQVKMQTQLNENKDKRVAKTEELKQNTFRLDEFKKQNIDIYTKSTETYNKSMAKGERGILQQESRSRAEREIDLCSKNLTSAQATYSALRSPDNHLPIGEDVYAVYTTRRQKIWMDDLQEIKEKLKIQTRRYEDIFKNEFVLTVLKSCESAREDIKQINRQLSRLEFTTKYEFDVEYVKDNSDFEKILEYARYLKEREELGITPDQMVLSETAVFTNEQGEELEKEIKKIISRIIESNDKEKIDQYADYRNYMKYEILLSNDVLKKSKLSRQSGYNSGAEVQIPYLLILLSALLMIYNDKVKSTRLVFIDEPFAKMDPGNVKIMLDFMKTQELQMIFCAPDKTEIIGNECDVILPVLRTQANTMEMGIIDIKKEHSDIELGKANS